MKPAPTTRPAVRRMNNPAPCRAGVEAVLGPQALGEVPDERGLVSQLALVGVDPYTVSTRNADHCQWWGAAVADHRLRNLEEALPAAVSLLILVAGQEEELGKPPPGGVPGREIELVAHRLRQGGRGELLPEHGPSKRSGMGVAFPDHEK